MGAGCANKQFKMDPTIKYKLDAVVYVRKLGATGRGTDIVLQKIEGMGVVRSHAPYNLLLETPGKFDMMYFNTCGRSESFEKEGKLKKIYYAPDADLEIGCGATISGYDSKKSKHSFAMIEFEVQHPELNMETLLVCNGKRETHKLNSCQTKAGTYVRLETPLPTIVHISRVGCTAEHIDGTPITNDLTLRKIYQFPVPLDECEYTFQFGDKSQGVEEKKSKLSTYGYQEVPVRSF